MDTRELAEHLACAVGLVESAGPIACGYFRRGVEVEDKSKGGYFDPVTRADREIEAFLRAELAQRFPGYGIIGEEEGTVAADPLQPSWVIDPIDGTRAFISGMPAWGILLGLLESGSCRAGVMHQPYTDETFFGTPQGSWFKHEDRQLSLSTRATLDVSSAVLYCTDPSMFVDRGHRQAFDRVAAESRMRRYGGDCYAYCLLAMGQIDLVIEDNLQPYDIMPLIPIIEGAGGIVTSAGGGSANEGGFVVAAATERLHSQALAIINANE